MGVEVLVGDTDNVGDIALDMDMVIEMIFIAVLCSMRHRQQQ